MGRSLVVGFDPGLYLTGYGVLASGGAKPKLVEAGVFRMSKGNSLAERLAELHASAGELLDEHRPTSVAVEEIFSHYERPKTAILMGHARGVLLQAAASRKIAVAHYLPTRVKKFLTGNGHASKQQIQQAIQLEFDLPAQFGPPDVADAIAIAMCHCQQMKGDLALRPKLA
jgi:crossover junction endodeoxyribonuclease RuvC